ncbi:MAG: acyltransferase family protein [Cyanobacteria bacterium P01_D01_bin.44]
MQQGFSNQQGKPVSIGSKADVSQLKDYRGWRYRPEIDGLRAIAVLAVIINHFNPKLLPSGFLGVDMFFVISGFVVTASLRNKPEQSWPAYLLNFYSRRVKRLIPALITCVTITSLIGCFCILPQARELQPSLYTGMASLAGISNLYLFLQSTDYFGTAAELNLFTQTWSLGVEEQFYLGFPVLLGWCGFSQSKTSRGSQTLLTVIIGLVIASLVGYVRLSQTNAMAAFFLMPARFWELGLGCLAFLGTNHLSNNLFLTLKRILAPMSVLALLSMLFVSKDFQVDATIAISALSAVALTSFDVKIAIVKLLSWTWIVKIGLLSYSLYLWHWSVLVISRWTIGIHWFTVPFQGLGILGLAVLSYHYIETPLRRHPWSLKRSKNIAYGLFACLIASIALYGLSSPLKGKLYLLGGDEIPPNWARNEDREYIEFCHAEQGFEPQVFEACLSKASDPTKQSIFLLGDSHARNILKGLESAFPNWNVNYATMGHGCGVIPIENISPELDRRVNCSGYVNGIIGAIENPTLIKPGDLIVIGSLTGNIGRHDQVGWQAFEDNIEEISRQLKQNQAYLILTSDVPGLSIHVSRCLKNRLRKIENPLCQRSIKESRNRHKKIYEIANTLDSKLDNFYFLDYHDQLCHQNLCSAYLGDQVIYFDADHISDKVSQDLGKFIQNWAEMNGIIPDYHKNGLNPVSTIEPYPASD